MPLGFGAKRKKMTSDNLSAKDTDTIRQLVTGYQVARALLAADEIGLLEHLQDGSSRLLKNYLAFWLGS